MTTIDAEVGRLLQKEWREALEQLLYHSLHRTKFVPVWEAKVARLERVARRNNIKLSGNPTDAPTK